MESNSPAEQLYHQPLVHSWATAGAFMGRDDSQLLVLSEVTQMTASQPVSHHRYRSIVMSSQGSNVDCFCSFVTTSKRQSSQLYHCLQHYNTLASTCNLQLNMTYGERWADVEYGPSLAPPSQSSLGSAPTDAKDYAPTQALELLALTQTAAQATDVLQNINGVQECKHHKSLVMLQNACCLNCRCM